MRSNASCMLSIIAAAALLLDPAQISAQAALSRFEGSVEKGVYEVDFAEFIYPTSVAKDSPLERIEGALDSRVFVKPQQKSNLEVFRSYERELAAAGFTTLVSETPSRDLQQRIWNMYRNTARLSDRYGSYRSTEDRILSADLARIETFPDYYIVAERTRGDELLTVAIIISRDQNLYMIEEVITAAMETGTVSINIEALRSEIEASGKIAVYDIHFATGSAVIEPESAEALAVIASYLSEVSGGFYIVGHTDDTGSLESNLTLSEQRAAAVKASLLADYGVDAGRLETRGVGPLAPVSTNIDDAGRALNRRVEIVQRLR